MTFKEIIESYGKMLSFSCTAYTSLSEKHCDITEDEIASANLKFDGALYTSVMRCLYFVFKGDFRAIEKGFKFSDCSLTANKDNDSATINYGTFFVAEAPEFNDADNTTKLICYDKMYLTMRPFSLKLSYPIKLKDFTKAVLDECGLTCANLDELRNGEMYVQSEQFLNVANDEDKEGKSPYTYRDALDNVARSAGCSFAHKSDANGENVDELYVVYVTDGKGNMKEPLHTLDISNFKTLTIGEKYGPANAVIFSRQPQEDNVYLKSEGIISENTVEVKFTQPLTAEGTDEERKAWLPAILMAVKGTEYQCYSLESYGIGYLNFGDVFKIKAFKRNGLVLDYDSPEEYLSVFMRTDMMIDGNIKETTKLEMPVATSTDYNAATSPAEKQLFQAYMKVDKQLGEIIAKVNDPQNGLEAKFNITAEAVKTNATKIETFEKAGYTTSKDVEGIIETKAENIALSVTEKLNIGTRNILLDSACFEIADLGYHNAEQYLDPNEGSLDKVEKDATVPSGEKRLIAFIEKPPAEGRVSGVTFNSQYILDEEINAIGKVSAEKTYTLSFYMQGVAFNGKQRSLSLINLLYVGTGASVNYISYSDLSLSTAWKKYSFTFSITGKPTDFRLRLLTEGETDTVCSFAVSSFKLEEGNVATDWTPNSQEIENAIQDVEAKLDLCVKTDKNGNLISAIHAKANQITIESDNFTLTEDGRMTCKGATIENGTIKVGDEDEISVIKIAEGKIIFISESDELGYITAGLGGLVVNADKAAFTVDTLDFHGLSSSSDAQINVYGTLDSDVIRTPMMKVLDSKGNTRIQMYLGNWKIGNETIGQDRDTIYSTGGLYINAANGAHGLYLAGSTIRMIGPTTFTASATLMSNIILGNNISMTGEKTLSIDSYIDIKKMTTFHTGQIYLNSHIGLDPVAGTTYRFLVVDTDTGSINSVNLQ